MKLNKDLREFIELLNSHDVEYVVVGAHCLAFYGLPRATGDLDLFVRVSADNARRLEQVMAAFGFASTGLKAKDFLEPGQVIQLGIVPNRVDLLTSIESVAFDEAWSTRIAGTLEGLPVHFLNKDLFIRNKLAVGRSQDIADADRVRNIKSNHGETSR